MAEFTGERVIPGQVDPDLWNEHISRYAFAGRLADRKQVLDAGCGSGYGALELARTAARAVAVDVSAEAIFHAQALDGFRKVTWIQASVTALPFVTGSFNLVVAFEVIEHIHDWRAMLGEVRRVLAAGGHFVVSTPNKAYYSETRKHSGPNPFHCHEFEFDEFQNELHAIFPRVSLFVQNHSTGILFRSISTAGDAEVQLEGEVSPTEAHFFIAVCGVDAPAVARSFVYVPHSGNVLREREQHIAQLEAELAMKNDWLADARAEHQKLLELHRLQTAELEKSNHWAAELDAKLRAAGARVVELQGELEHEQATAASRISELEAEHASAIEWARDAESRLERSRSELARCVTLLDNAEKTVEERTNWALTLDAQKQALETKINLAMASRWLKLGRAIGLGPKLQDV